MQSDQHTVIRKVVERPEFRFALRPCSEADISRVYEAVAESREHVGKWMPWLTDEYSISHAKEWVHRAITEWDKNEAYEFVMIDREDDSVTGCCGLNAIKWMDKVCNLGYWVRTSKLRLGAARQAVELLREFGFGKTALNRLEIVVAADNEPSRRVAESAGALYEGIQRQRICVHEAVHDARMYALLRNP